MMLTRTSARISLSIALLALLMGGWFGVSYVLVQGQEHDTLHVRLAARQGVLVERVAKEVATYVATEGADQRLQQRDTISHAIAAFESHLAALQKGGEATLALETTTTTPPVRDPAALTHLSRAAELWTPYARMARRVIDDPRDEEALAYVLTHDAELVDAFDSAAGALHESAQTHRATHVEAQALALGVGLLLALLLAFWLLRSVSRPMGDLARAAEAMTTGDLSGPIEARGPEEAREIADALERMRLSLHTMMDEAGAAFPDDDLESDGTEDDD